MKYLKYDMVALQRRAVVLMTLRRCNATIPYFNFSHF